MPFRVSGLMKADVQGALSDQGYTATRAGKLDNLDATISSRPSGSDYSAARAAKLDQLDAAISSRAAPGATMDLAAGAKAAIWNETIPGTPTVGSFGERIKNNLNATIDSRASGADYTAARAAKLDQLDASITSRASGTDYTAARAAKLDNIDAAITTRASPADVDTQLGNRGITTGRMAKLDAVLNQAINSGSVASGANTTGLTVQLDTSGASGQARSVVEVRYTAGAGATFYAEGSDDGTTWYQGDTFSEAGAVTNKLVGYLNTNRYFRFRSPTAGIDLSFEVRALL